jgi:drug/metabolite transporter (DMT)-like permease
VTAVLERPRAVAPSAGAIAAALTTIYLVWGSTYLAIRWTVHELPPLLAGGLRFSVAGLGFLLAARLRGPITVTRRQLGSAALIGLLMPGVSNGLVGLAERQIPSGLAALLVALVPLWIVLFQWLGAGSERPRPRAVGGLALGFAGTALLVWSGQARAGLAGVAMVIAASLLWAAGMLVARAADRPRPWMASSGIEMLAGGVVQAVLGIAHGELPRALTVSPSGRATGALIYLAVVGGWGGYGAFSWLTRHARPTLVATSSYVNPLVAVLLGFALAGEPLGLRTLAASGLIVCSVVLVTTAR